MNIVTYNILSSELCSPSYFHMNTEEEMDKDNRFNLLTQKLRYNISQEYVICLQEVCNYFREKLILFFKDNNYHVIDNNYGSRFNGFMGVMTAFPKMKYQLLDVKFINTSLLYKHKQEFYDQTILLRGLNFLRKLTFLGEVKVETDKSVNLKKEFERTNNHFVYVKLRDSNNKEISITNIHMPCKFYHPEFMKKYIELFLEHHSSFKDENWIICGDFNSKVKDSWFVPLINLNRVDNEKDLYSCVTKTKNLTEVFKEKIDYVFHSPSLKCLRYEGYTSDETIIPSKLQGSDHYSISCKFSY